MARTTPRPVLSSEDETENILNTMTQHISVHKQSAFL